MCGVLRVLHISTKDEAKQNVCTVKAPLHVNVCVLYLHV